ncbi:fatty acid desaturase [Aestuariibius sp. 2305UL40-4]|uniref:fatty acid desaturase n=1 Tax=Aestuariibius violaceus TaxID=3234132 RepID=UPI00345E7543
MALFLPQGLAILALMALIALYASLQHEVLHGHPFESAGLNEALVWPTYTLIIPYRRFRDTHLAHHRDEALTDPYEDPESNYLDPAKWARLPSPLRWLLEVNNTLAGRMLFGPLIGTVAFLFCDVRRAVRGEPRVIAGWLFHLPAMASTLAIILLSPVSLTAYLVAVYGALALLRIRTFLEHRAHERASARTVIIEDRGFLAFLFLNNNFHVVHHMHPKVPWYDLPALYEARRDHYLTRNQGYRYASYADVFRRHFVRSKDPVPHPLFPKEDHRTS